MNSVTSTPEKDELKKHFLAAKRIRKEVGIVKFRFQSPISVDTLESRTRTVFFDVAFLKRAGDASAREATRVGLVEKTSPDRGAGCPGGQGGAVVRLLLWLANTSEVRLEEPGLRPEGQLRAEQGQDLFKYYSSSQVEKADPACKSSGRHRLPTHPGLLKTCKEVLR